MTRKKTIVETVEDDAEVPADSLIVMEEEPTSVDEAALQRAVEELGADINTVRIVVYRVRPNRDPEECIDCPFDQFTKAALRDQYGPGDYLLQLRVKGLIRRKHTLHFAAPLERASALPVPSQQPLELAGLFERASQQMSARFAEMQLAHSHEMMELMRSLLARDVTPRTDPIVLQGQFIDQAVKLQDLMGRRGGADDLDRFAKLLEISRELVGGEAKGATGADVALELMRMAKPVLELSKVAADATGRQLPPAAASTEGSPPMQKIMIRYGLRLLVKNAQADNDPLAYAEVLVDNVPPASLAALLSADDWFERLCLLEPAAAPYRTWFTELREAVLQLNQPEGDSTVLPAGAAGGDSAAGSGTAVHVPKQPTAPRQPGAAAVGGVRSPRDTRAHARPGSTVQSASGADRSRPGAGSRSQAKGRR